MSFPRFESDCETDTAIDDNLYSPSVSIRNQSPFWRFNPPAKMRTIEKNTSKLYKLLRNRFIHVEETVNKKLSNMNTKMMKKEHKGLT